jgi:Cytochrome c553
MKMPSMTNGRLQRVIVVTLLMGMGWSVFSAETPVIKSAVTEADLSAGEKIATAGGANGATACFACHGAKGSENLTGAFPRIAGQSPFYMVTQLKDFASGLRKSEVMEPIAKALSEQEMHNVSEFYASLTPEVLKSAKKIAAADLKRGELLAKTGDMKLQVQACANCHGPGGIGMAPAIPFLAGQFSTYTDAQLKAWKSGTRKNSPGQMLEIANRLSEKDMAALSAYFEQVKR